MATTERAPEELERLINSFKSELPDPKRTQQSAFIKQATHKGKKVMLFAQLVKRGEGLTWAVYIM